MIKMIIRLDEEKILRNQDYSKDRILAALDRIFAKTGMSRVDTLRGTEYCGQGISSDFARFGKIMLGLKEQDWFMDNAKDWILCNSDDSEDPNEFEEEDLMAHYLHSSVS